jgi:hypothetical protein
MLLMHEAKVKPGSVFFVGYIAHKMGLKSSTKIKNLCRHLVSLDIGVIQVSSKRGDAFCYKFPVQTDFLDRVILINHKPITVRDEIHSLLRLS